MLQTLRRTHMTRLFRCTRAVSTIEVALLTPVLCVLVMGITDVAQMGAMKSKYQQATRRGLELATAGTVTSTAIKSQVAAASGVSESQVAVTYTLECDEAETTYSGTCGPGQESARYIRVAVNGTYTPKFNYGPLGRIFTLNEQGSASVSAGALTRIQ